MDKHNRDNGRPANVAKDPPQDATERQHQRELLAKRIGQLLARRWFGDQQAKRLSVRQSSPRLDADAAKG